MITRCKSGNRRKTAFLVLGLCLLPASCLPPATLAAPSPGLLTRGRVALRLGLRLSTTQSTGVQLHPIVGKRGVRYLDCTEVDAMRVRGQRSNRRKLGLRKLASASRLQAVGGATWSRGGYFRGSLR